MSVAFFDLDRTVLARNSGAYGWVVRYELEAAHAALDALADSSGQE